MKQLLILPLLVLSLNAAEVTLQLSTEQVAALEAVVLRMNAEAEATAEEGVSPTAITVQQYAVMLAFAQINAVTRDEQRRAEREVAATVTALPTTDRELVRRLIESDTATKEAVKVELDKADTTKEGELIGR